MFWELTFIEIALIGDIGFALLFQVLSKIDKTIRM